MSAQPRRILKYPNRRLYDTLEHRYITLHDVRQFVLSHVDFSVVNKSTATDVTVDILLNVISVSHASAEEPRLERAFLLDTIRQYCTPSPAKAPVSEEGSACYAEQDARKVA